MQNGKDIVELVGRILISIIFLGAAMNKITGFAGTRGYMMGMPTFQMLGENLTSLFLVGAICLLLVGGISIVVGFNAKLGAIALIIFLVPTTFIFHNFWAMEEAKAGMQRISFLKNIAILGGLFIIAIHGVGALSLDAKRNEADSGDS